MVFQMLSLQKLEHVSKLSLLRLSWGFDRFNWRAIQSLLLRRIANTDAHTLAGEGRRFSVPRYWIEEALEMVEWTAERDRQR
ncbi:hypothetical protein GOBAR_AA04303 [Gossypium barbadense]|uniref:Uncharacterized protein n=1 Tax=Gossypium barbadense TaxID=3634 RepID=A0A2P5YL15_GOSBA|nr:hypothetical protein GOBAR_AA04303 [Gossypium barbadense]